MNQVPPATSPDIYTERLSRLRDEIRKAGLDGFLVPMSDAFLNEYIAPCDKRIRFLTGFRGTAGFVIVMLDRAAFFTDSRYTLQAENEVQPKAAYTLFDTAKQTPGEWLAEAIHPKMKIGFDPKLHAAMQITKYEAALLKKNASLTPCDDNLIDLIWHDRPTAAIEPFSTHELVYTGKDSATKRRELGDELRKKGLNAAIIPSPASVAWLLNVRGQDVPYTPLPLSYAILRTDGSLEWFFDPRKLTPSVEAQLGPEVTRYAIDELPKALRRLGEIGAKVLVDPNETPYQIFATLRQSGATIEEGQDPCALPRACKNRTEVEGARAAHRRDGAALVRLMAWLDGCDAPHKLSEVDVADKLEALRAEGSLYRGLSFATIAASGPNGAIVHYTPRKQTARLLDKDSLLLIDSGAQYLDGTTDVTRTIALGEITPEMKDRYTRVLKGHIAIACLRFPEGTSGADIDAIARRPLWAIGLDYGHGTGHGVGSYLGVHEGPHGISRRGASPLMPGMVLSNEPGFYKARHYGIRLENLQLVTEVAELSSAEKRFFGFEPLTLAPFDRRAIEPKLLDQDELAWLNAYHSRVHKALRPQLDEPTGQWLAEMTAEIT